MKISALFILAVVIVSMSFFVTPFTAHAFGIPFGGKAISTPVPCLGSGLYWVEIAQPLPRPPIAVIFYPSPFPFYAVWHIGQSVLGVLAPVGFCATAPHQGFWAPTALYYGSSL